MNIQINYGIASSYIHEKRFASSTVTVFEYATDWDNCYGGTRYGQTLGEAIVLAKEEIDWFENQFGFGHPMGMQPDHSWHEQANMSLEDF